MAALCQTLLSDKTKDLKVAAYLGVALLKLGGVAGLSAGVQVLRDLIANFWETMQPEKSRLRGRLNATAWWQDRAEAFLASYGGEELPRQAVELLGQRLHGLDASLSAQPPDAPVPSRLMEYADGLPSPESESQSSEPTSAPEASAGRPPAVAAPASDPPAAPREPAASPTGFAWFSTSPTRKPPRAAGRTFPRPRRGWTSPSQIRRASCRQDRPPVDGRKREANGGQV